MMPVNVIAKLQAMPGKRADLLRAFEKHRPNVLQDPGCLEFFAVVDADPSIPSLGPDSYLVYETWATLADQQNHANAVHQKSYAALTAPLVAQRLVTLLAVVP